MTVTGMALGDACGPISRRPPRRRHLMLSVLAAVVGLSLAQPASAQAPAFDLVLRNGRVVDGTGSPWYRADLAIRGDTIVRIAPSIPDRATRVIDVEGRVITPGFIDVHTHAAARNLRRADRRQLCAPGRHHRHGGRRRQLAGSDWAVPGQARGTAEIAQHRDLYRAGIGPRRPSSARSIGRRRPMSSKRCARSSSRA